MHIFAFENSQNSFSCGPLFGPFVSGKYFNSGKKLPIQTTYHTFLERRQPEVTQNLYYVLPRKGSQKKVSTHGLLLIITMLFLLTDFPQKLKLEKIHGTLIILLSSP